MSMPKRFVAFFAAFLPLPLAFPAFAGPDIRSENGTGTPLERPADDTVQQGPTSRVLKGATSQLGRGTARTWVELDAKDRPKKVVVSIPDASLDPGHDMSERVMALPETAGLPFKSAVINWMPHGHAPMGIFDVPHFDVHFYMMDEASRAAITLRDDQADRAAKAPPARYAPIGFVSSGMAAPAMGMHWIDPTAPEFNGEPFGATFIYGFYDGRMNFMEVMAAKAMIDRKGEVVKPINQPGAYRVAGRYPTRDMV
jgi:hypothetical protein